jgi:hypothetical protein
MLATQFEDTIGLAISKCVQAASTPQQHLQQLQM